MSSKYKKIRVQLILGIRYAEGAIFFALRFTTHTFFLDFLCKFQLEPNSCFPLWPRNDSDHMMVVKVDGQRTVPFKYSEPCCNLLQLNMHKVNRKHIFIFNIHFTTRLLDISL